MHLMEQTLRADVSTGTARTVPLLAGEGIAVVFVVIVLPVALYLADLAAHARLLYPALNLIVAAYLYERRSPWYAAHCLLIFCCVSLVRRLIDQQAGFDPSNPALLTPYLCCLLTVTAFFDYWARRQPRSLGPFLIIMACIAYGTALAMLDGRIRSSLVDVLKWSVGPLFAVYLLHNRDRAPQIRAVLEPCLIVAAAAMALYGVAQFANPPAWDATWMRGVAELGFDSIGRPEPYQLRAFSTMNSPGAFGAILSAGMVIALKRRLPVCLLAILPMLAGLALCQYRSLWAATLLAIVMVALAPGAGVRRANIAALFVAALALASTALSPEIRHAVVQRANSLTELEGDYSLGKRLDQYREFFRHDNLVIGEGLAINGASRRLDNRQGGEIDGAIIEVYRAMGVLVGTAFMLSIAVLIASLFRNAAVAGSHIYYDRAIVLSLFVQFPIGTVNIGELGFCGWTFMGFGLAALYSARERA
jgi:hypothetical protein